MLNHEEITKLADHSQTARHVIEAWSQRKRFRRTTDLNRFYLELINQGFKIIEAEYYEFFKLLEKAGLGSLINGRRLPNGKSTSSRFLWNYSLKDVAKAAKTGQKVAIEKLGNKAPVVMPNTDRTVRGTRGRKPNSITVTLEIPREQLEAILRQIA